MSTPYIVTGDNTALPVQLKKNRAVFNIPQDAVVKVAIVSSDHGVAYTAAVEQSYAATGADWANSLIVLELPAEETANVSYSGPAKLEVQVTNDGVDDTWFVDVELIRGHVS
jgi:hypothetical protein